MTPSLEEPAYADRDFERLYRRHVGDVYRYSLAVLRDAADAEDVTKTTFVNAYRALERGERPGTPHHWLITIAHDVCRQRHRQTVRRPVDVTWDEDMADRLVAEGAVVRGEDVRRALSHLAFNQRAALVMRELEGRPYVEIADVLELSVGAVETLIFRARRALREQLEAALTCGEAEFAISQQLDGRLERPRKGALRAHMRECAACAGFARDQRGQRAALKALATVDPPASLVSLFGTARSGRRRATRAAKAAALLAAAAAAGGAVYAGVARAVHHDVKRPAPMQHRDGTQRHPGHPPALAGK